MGKLEGFIYCLIIVLGARDPILRPIYFCDQVWWLTFSIVALKLTCLCCMFGVVGCFQSFVMRENAVLKYVLFKCVHVPLIFAVAPLSFHSN
ncbi:hypothetical protein XENTR_v10002899 [Xenopus tropicalis]|nr:hypothetical protein XENTR_v10002899 [Xenopus tropicalis]